MAELYRKSALERISSPEQLDKALKVTSPMSWLALLALTVIVIVTLIWSIVGTIPVTVTQMWGIDIFTGCDNLTAIHYGGTVAQWKKVAISDPFPHLTVRCTDGTVNT